MTFINTFVIIQISYKYFDTYILQIVVLKQIKVQNQLYELTMTFVGTDKLCRTVVINDVTQPGAGCGHNNIPTESLYTSCNIWRSCV